MLDEDYQQARILYFQLDILESYMKIKNKNR